MSSRVLQLAIALLIVAPPLAAQTIDLSRVRIIDLTHPMDEHTLYWPTSPSAFELKELSHGMTEGGYFYASYAFCTPEHGGTHLDAPLHFAEGGRPAGEIPVSQLVGPAVVIDITRQSAANPVYQLAVEDVQAYEREHGRIPEGAIVLARTGWSRFWPDRKAYFGDDTPGDASKLRFPGFSADATKLLAVERKAGALGIDTASLDYGPSTDFMAHRIGAAAGVPNLENLTNLDQLPPRGAVVVALPVKIAHGSGGPVRVIALVP